MVGLLSRKASPWGRRAQTILYGRACCAVLCAVPFLFVCIVLFSPRFVFAYGDKTTHPALTEAIVEEYNRRNPDKKISPERKELIVKGSMLEDTPPRWVNHLYDPIQKISWNGEKLGRVPADTARALITWGIDPGTGWTSALDWIDNREAQARYDRYGGDRTWTQAMDYYANQNFDEAYLTLGYVFHLLEDMGVPEHTRNDPHPHSTEKLTGDTGSPYENYAKRWTRENIQDGVGRLDGLSPVSKGTIRDYVESMALYSNKYFFSKDSINDSAYELPKIVKEIDGVAYGLDENGVAFFLAKYVDVKVGNIDFQRKYTLETKDLYFFDAYFSRLSRQIVMHGVGALELFEREARDYVPQHVTRLNTGKMPFSGLWSPGIEIAKFGGAVKNFFGNILSGASSLFSKTFEGGETTEEISLTQNDDDEGGRISKGDITPYDNEDTEMFCVFQTKEVPTRGEVILNEVAWMGVVGNARAEWFEVRNVSGRAFDLSGFQLVDGGGDIQFRFPTGAKMGSGSFLTLAREGESFSFRPDFLYEGNLANSKEALRLFNSKCGLVDEAVGLPAWPAGENSSKKTMERAEGFSWYTSASVGGSPGGENSLRNSSTSLGDNEEENDENEEIKNEEKKTENKKNVPVAVESLLVKDCAFETSVSPWRDKVLINEVAWMGTTLNTSDEWVEMKNISGERVAFSGWQLLNKKGSARVRFEEASGILPGGFFLLERSDDATVPNVKADVIYTGAISNSDDGLRLFDSSCELQDEVFASPSWPGGSTFSKGTMERRGDFGWQTSGVAGGTPREENTIVSLSQSLGGSPSSNTQTVSQASSVTSSPPASPVILISEIQAGSASDTKQEFVELYNAGESDVNLADWDIKKKTSSGTLGNLATNMTGTIRAKGFFLIASQEYEGSVVADQRYTQTSQTLAGSNNSVVLYDEDGDIIDEFAYAEIVAGQSLERRAVSGGVCVSSQGNGEYLGNGCDVSGDSSDFEVRVAPNPQNTSGLSESRSQSSDLNFQAVYSSSTLEFSFSWNSYAHATSYSVFDITNGTSSLRYTGTSTSFSERISEVGRDYSFLLRLTDDEGYAGDIASTTTSAPDFFDSFSFYRDTRGGATDYLLDMYYAPYPFVPDLYWSSVNDSWKAVVFYLNRDPGTQEFLYNSNDWGLDSSDGALRVKYDRCGGGTNTPGYSLLLPDNASRCGTGGGLMNNALTFSKLEDEHLLLKTASSTGDVSFFSTDYVTAAFYSFYNSGGGQQTFKLVAFDKTKRYFQDSLPAQAAPSTPENLSASFNETNSTVRFSFASSTDSDTLNHPFITYQFNYSTSSELDEGAWQSNGTSLSKTLDLPIGETYFFGVRAVDDFGNVSTSSVIQYVVPTPTPPLTISNVRWGMINASSASAQVSFDFQDVNTLAPGVWNALVFYVSSTAPDKGNAIGGFNTLLNDGLSKLSISYYGACQGTEISNTPSLGGSICGSGFRNYYSPLDGSYPSSGRVTFTVRGSYSSTDYITILFLKYESNDMFSQYARYVVPVYFTSAP